MSTWKKSLKTTIASFCVLMGSTSSQWATAQNSSPSSAAPRVAESMVNDSIPFSTPYRPGQPPFTDVSTKPLPSQPIPDQSLPISAMSSPGIVPPATASPSPHLPAATQNEVAVEINNQNNGKFAVKLKVPDSVTFVEIQPTGGAALQRSFKIRLDSTETVTTLTAPLPTAPIGQPETMSPSSGAMQTMPPVAAAKSASGPTTNLPTSLPSHALTRRFADASPTNQPSNPTLPVDQLELNNRGFKRNPFFGNRPTENLLLTGPLDNQNGVPVVLEANVAIQNRRPKSILASYRNPNRNNLGEAEIDDLDSSLEGPTSMKLGATGNFAVYITNQNAVAISGVNVELAVPLEIDVVLIDREAKIDQDKGTLTWSLGNIEPGGKKRIRYRIKTLGKGNLQQRVSVHTNNGSAQVHEHLTFVKGELPNSGVSSLPFESN